MLTFSAFSRALTLENDKLFSGNNKYAWGLGILSLILLILIIVVAVKISKK